MGQIFNRLKRLVSSYFVSDGGYTAERLINEEDEELKRIIDELNREYVEGKKKHRERREYQQAQGHRTAEIKDEKLVNAYKILGVSPNASIDEIKRAFRERVKQHHPDKFEKADSKTKLENQKKVRELISAYNLIKESRGSDFGHI